MDSVTSPEGEIRELMEAGVAERVFPGAQALIRVGRRAPLHVATGAHTYDAGARAVDVETLYDVASLTKVLVTTTAVLQLAEQKRLALSDAVGAYLPAFGRDGKDGITLRHLLTHTSGLRADIGWRGLGDGDALWDAVEREPPVSPPGTSHVYSDLGFLLLGRVVALVAGVPLDAYAHAHIFGPLGMDRTRYTPPPAWRPGAAPTEIDASWRGALVQGQVHDEKAYLLGGVAGHAGLFSTAGDLDRFLGALLACLGGADGFVLGRETVQAMTRNQTPDLPVRQGLGWVLDQPFLGDLRPGAFGHTGFTGVSVAASPAPSVACIVLTNCVYPTRPDAAGRRRLSEIRAGIAGAALRMAEGEANEGKDGRAGNPQAAG